MGGSYLLANRPVVQSQRDGKEFVIFTFAVHLRTFSRLRNERELSMQAHQRPEGFPQVRLGFHQRQIP